MSKSSLGPVTAALLFSIGTGAPPTTFAQEGQATAAAVGLEEIVVTARKRQESLQETPIAVSAFSFDDMEERNITSSSEVTQFAPNVQFDASANESGGGGSSQIAIRGIGQTDYVITVEPGVGLYLDGVYIGKSVGSLIDTIDLEQIEVLRGPQGTLFGKNTIGGAIVLTSRRPSAEPEFSLDVTTGRYDRIDVKTTLSGAIHERLRLRFSGASQNRDGHVKRIVTGQRQGNKDSVSGRLVGEIDVTENLLATVTVDASASDEESPGQVLLRALETGFFPALHNGGLIPGVADFPACDPTIPGNTARFTNPNCFNSQWVTSVDSRENFSTGPNESDTSVWGGSLKIDWDLGEFSVRSISAYRNVDVDLGQDLALNPIVYFDQVFQDINLEQVSQEFQLFGKAFDDRLSYLLGFFYNNEFGSQAFGVFFDPVDITSGGSIDNESIAGFGEATYDITDQLSLTFGARFTHEKVRFRPEQTVDNLRNPVIAAIIPTLTPGQPLLPRVQVQNNENNFSPRVTLSYEWTDELLTYFTYSQGFKSAGYTMRVFPPVIPGVTTPLTDPDDFIPSFGPEEVQLFEGGIKSEWFDRRMRLNLAGFVTNYDDLQLLTNTGIAGLVPVIVNAGDARVWGVEAETEIVPTDWLRINGSIGWLDNKYLKVDPGADGITTDDRLANAPKWSTHLGATIDVLRNEHGHVFLRGDWSYKSRQEKDARNLPLLSQDAYHLVTASASWRSVDEHWLVSVGGTNLANEIYIISGTENDGTGITQATVSRPREWFLRVKYSY